MADHTCNSDLVTDRKELVSVAPGGKKTYQLWQETSCNICGRLASKVYGGTVEE